MDSDTNPLVQMYNQGNLVQAALDELKYVIQDMNMMTFNAICTPQFFKFEIDETMQAALPRAYKRCYTEIEKFLEKSNQAFQLQLRRVDDESLDQEVSCLVENKSVASV